jgi:putative hydrolase of the HAD superfamily
MIDLSGIKNIIFDLGGVILNIDYNKTSQAFKDLGFLNFDEFYSQKEQTTIFNQLETGKITEIEFVTEIQKHCPTLNYYAIITAWNAMLLDLPKERIELIDPLSKKYNVFLLSNTNAIHYQSFINSIENEFGKDILTPCFQKVFYSHEIGQRKPNKSCFEYVLKEAKVNAKETLFLDDSIQHIHGAQSCNINTHFVDVKNGDDILTLFPDTIL